MATRAKPPPLSQTAHGSWVIPLLALHLFIISAAAGMSLATQTPFLIQHECVERGLPPATKACKENVAVQASATLRVGQLTLAMFLPAALTVSLVAAVSDTCGRRFARRCVAAAASSAR